jgi:hypothetical protein
MVLNYAPRVVKLAIHSAPRKNLYCSHHSRQSSFTIVLFLLHMSFEKMLLRSNVVAILQEPVL